MPTEHEFSTGRRFDVIAPIYDTQREYAVRDQIRLRVQAILTDMQVRSIVDIGCGTGTLLNALAPRIDRGLGIDVSAGMLEQAKAKAAGNEHGHKLEFIQAGFADLPNLQPPVTGFDAAVACYSMHHLEWAAKDAAIQAMIAATDGGMGIVIIGDLMLFADASTVAAENQQPAGYDPNTDIPEPPDRLAAAFHQHGWSTTIQRLHDLAGIIIARKDS